MWCLVRSFSYIPDAGFSESTLFLPVLVWAYSDTPDASQIFIIDLMWCLVKSFSYIPDAGFNESTFFLPVLVWAYSDTPDASQILMSFTYTLRVQWY